MANLPQIKNEAEIKALTVAKVRNEYNKIASVYEKIIDGELLRCPKCGDFLTVKTAFYSNDNYIKGKYPICKKCLLAEVEQRKRKTDEPNETKESVKNVLRNMNLPYIDSFYEDCVKGANDGVKEKNRKSPFTTYITCILSLPQYRGMTWNDSEFDENEENVLGRRAKQKTIKFFGDGFSDKDYLFLQDQYDDWRTRYSIEDKSMEEIIKRICFKQLDLLKAQQKGRDTKELDKTFQDLLGSANLKPNQNKKNTLSDSQTFGTLIEKWEDEWEGGKPIPEPDEDFKDVDKIGLFLDVFFKGHLAKMLNLKNPLSHIYEKFISKYTVEKPEYDAEENSEALFDAIFGVKKEEDF